MTLLASGSVDIAKMHMPEECLSRYSHRDLDPCHRTSKDGSVRFSGADTLNVTLLDGKRLVFPLSSGFRRSTRTIRAVACTDDGLYALVLCSDGAMFLFRICNSFGTYAGDSQDGEGCLSLLFQVHVYTSSNIYLSLIFLTSYIPTVFLAGS